MKELILDIITQLKLTNLLEYVAEDWGQLDYYEQPPVKFPCALISLATADYQQQTKENIKVDYTIAIRIADSVKQLSAAAPGSMIDDSLSTLSLVEQVRVYLTANTDLTITRMVKTPNSALRDYTQIYRITKRL